MKRLGFIAGLVVGLTACGGSGTDLGVAGSKRLSEIDADETCTLWEEFAGWQSKFTSASCTLLGQGLGAAAAAQGEDFTAACEAARDDCQLKDFSTEEFVCADVENNIPDTCDVTVSETEACLDDALALFDEVVKLGCDEPLDATVLAELQAEGGSTDALPESCQGFYGPNCLGADG